MGVNKLRVLFLSNVSSCVLRLRVLKLCIAMSSLVEVCGISLKNDRVWFASWLRGRYCFFSLFLGF